jgi:hypothetical protein
MRLRKRKSGLDDWLNRGTNPEKLWKLLFYFFSRFILVFCVLHYVGVAYPEIGWVFPSPTSDEFWACCVVFSVIFAAVFYVVRGKREGGDGSRKGNTESSPAVSLPVVSLPAMTVEEKRKGRHGGVGRATFEPEPELEEQRGEHEGDRRQ